MTIYVNFDIETTGSVPGLYSMVSFGAIAHQHNPESDFVTLGQFEINIKEMEDADWDPSTRAWWESPEQAKAFEHTFAAPQVHPDIAMEEICAWLFSLAKYGGPIVFVAYPATFDMSFLNYYMQRFVPKTWKELTFNKMVGWSCMDILSMASMLLNEPYLSSTKRHWPEEWVSENVLPHTAMSDARSQAESFVAMMRARRVPTVDSKVWVVVYNHRHGFDIWTTSTEEKALYSATEVIHEYIVDLPEEVQPEIEGLIQKGKHQEAIDKYTEVLQERNPINGESFTIEEKTVT